MSSLEQLVEQTRTQPSCVTERVATAIQQAETQSFNIFTPNGLFKEQALQQATDLTAKWQTSQSFGRLAGVVFTVKDNFLYQGSVTTAAAPFLADFVAPYTGTCLQKLLDEDAILLGKTNLDAFAHGTSTENSYFGATKNPYQADLTPGGSSGGSGAAVASQIGSFSLGTDTGGSVRLPAAFCNVVGFKPTYGRLSRYGIVAMASSTDCVAPVTNSVADARYLLDILQGVDDLDGTTLNSADCDQAQPLPKELKIGFIQELATKLDEVVAQPYAQLRQKLETTDWQVVDISIPDIELALPCYYVLVSAEISSNLARYSGLHYGVQQGGHDWQQTIRQSRASGFMAENKRRIMLGSYVLSQGHYEAYYQRAQAVRTLLCQRFAQAFQQVDVLLSPVSPTPPFPLGSKIDDVLQMYAADLMTVAPSLVGLPATSLPLPTTGSPCGLQIMTPQKSDYFNLQVAQAIEELLA